MTSNFETGWRSQKSSEILKKYLTNNIPIPKHLLMHVKLKEPLYTHYNDYYCETECPNPEVAHEELVRNHV